MTINLPSVRTAKLPATYVKAREWLAKCERIDECKKWADQALALASYARQAKDDKLEMMARRIRDRALARCGALLDDIDKQPGMRSDLSRAPNLGSARRKAAKDAGLSPFQASQAIAVSHVPKEKFEEMVEANKPATIEELAEEGRTRKHAIIPEQQHPEFANATILIGILKQLSRYSSEHEVANIIEAISKREARAIYENLMIIKKWFSGLERQIKKRGEIT